MKTKFSYDYDLLLQEYQLPQDIHEANSVVLNDAYRAALQQTAKISITDHQGIILYVNDKFCEISEYRVDELIGNTHRILSSGYHPKSFFSEMWHTIQAGQIWNGEICNKSKNGHYYWVDTVIVPFRNNYATQYKYLQ